MSLRAFLLLSLVGLAGCDMMMPGTVGWFCESSDDCNEGLRCVSYVHEGTDHENRLCTGEARLEDTSSNHGWISLVVSWLLCVITPALLVILVVVGKIRDALRGDETARA